MQGGIGRSIEKGLGSLLNNNIPRAVFVAINSYSLVNLVIYTYTLFITLVYNKTEALCLLLNQS